MKAMILDVPRSSLRYGEQAQPVLGPDDVLIEVRACAVCRTDLHVVDGELPHPKLPLVPGHEAVGVVVECGQAVTDVRRGARVGVPWLGTTCRVCEYCRSGRENLCERAQFTGYDRDGGYSEFVAADARYVFPIPDAFDDEHAAPLLCAGLIGYRALRKAGEATRLGLYGFGASAHIITQVARWQGRSVFAFTRPGDNEAQMFARQMGAEWAGDSNERPPAPIDAAIIFAPVGALVPAALAAVAPGGIVVCAGIHMTDIPTFPYEALWRERTICSVANLTRRDGEEFFSIAPRVPVTTEIERYPLRAANEALARLRSGAVRGAAVLRP
jgi:alcohol dehydrogenase, propanol-preferring